MMRASDSARSMLRLIQYSDSATRESISVLPGGASSVASFEDPRVFAAAALRRVHDERTVLERDARERAGRNVDFLPVENERTQIDMTRGDTVADDRRMTRQRDDRLRQELARVRRHRGAEV